MENEEYKWDDTLKFGMDEVDDQHKLMIRSANKLNKALSVGHGRDVVEECMKEYMQFVSTHFAFEEKLFKEYDYMGAKEHIQRHDNFRKTFFEIIELIKKEGLTSFAAIKLDRFLNGWVVKHIILEKDELTPFYEKIKEAQSK